MGSDIYQKLPLLDASTSIRLARILPGWPVDELQVELSVVPHRSTAPEYEALSYVWGAPSCADIILCNGKPRTITANLASAIRALRPLPATGDLEQHGVHVIDEDHLLHSTRRPWKDFARNRYEAEAIKSRHVKKDADEGAGLFIWIDALCINQADLKECSEQVKGMCDIYRSARRVHIWLGTTIAGPGGTPLDLPGMKTSMLDGILSRISLADYGHMPVVLSFLAQALRNERILDDSVETRGLKTQPFGFPFLVAPEWSILAAFFENPWFCRVWIVQEVAMARQAIIILGDWEVDWEPFIRAVELFKCLNLESATSTRSLATRYNLQIWNGLRIGPAHYLGHVRQGLPRRENHLFDLLLDAHQRKATKQVDHIFAIIGMSDEFVHFDPNHVPCGWDEQSMLGLVDVDYTKSPSKVFRDVTVFIFLTQNTLLPLSMVGCANDPETSDIPSWVPQWAQPPRCSLFWMNRDSRKRYNADLG